MASRTGVSPGCGLRVQPLRATVAFQLRGAEGVRAASVPCFARGEKPGFPARVYRVRRTSSLDTILGSYLLGHWPRDPAEPAGGNDKATQTPLSWPGTAVEGSSTGTHKRSASWGTTEQHKQIVKVKHPMQKSKLSQGSQARCSPLLGDHALREPRDSPSTCAQNSPFVRHRPRCHWSLEDQELEEMFVKEISNKELLRVLDVPDGHRAPVPPQRCCNDLSMLSLELSNLLLPPSPSVLLRPPHSPSKASAEEAQSIALQSQLNPRDKEDGWTSPVCAAAASPRPNHSYKFQREPPEGCEKVEAYEETLSPGLDPALLHYGPDKNKVHFIPTGSAFCPISLVKPLLPNVDFLLRSFPTPGVSASSGQLSSCQARGQVACSSSLQDPEAGAFSGVPVPRWSPSQASEGSVFHSSLAV